MRELIIAKLTEYINDSEGMGIPRYFECEVDEYMTDTKELDSLNGEELLEMYDANVMFCG